jgi:hypothetical protein
MDSTAVSLGKAGSRDAAPEPDPVEPSVEPVEPTPEPETSVVAAPTPVIVPETPKLLLEVIIEVVLQLLNLFKTGAKK